MLTDGGTVKLLCCGMDRSVDDPNETALTSRGQGVGTARYVAPEQFTGGQVTPAADLYALGRVLYEMLAGVPPFTGENAFDLARKHTRETPEPLRALRSDTPLEPTSLVDRLRVKEADDRPADAAALGGPERLGRGRPGENASPLAPHGPGATGGGCDQRPVNPALPPRRPPGLH
jgi:serine/threonine protein kinase